MVTSGYFSLLLVSYRYFWFLVLVTTGEKTQHCEIVSAVNQVEEEKPETAHIVMRELPLVGQESDLENENNDLMCVAGLPNKVSHELEVFKVHNENLSDDGGSNVGNVETTA